MENFEEIARFLFDAKNGEIPDVDRFEAQRWIDFWNMFFEDYQNAIDPPWDWSSELAVEYAIWETVMYGNTEPLEKAIDAENQHIAKNDLSKKILSALVRGERPSKHLLRRRDTDFKGKEVMDTLYTLTQFKNMPLCGVNKKKSDTAIEVASRKHNLSPETIRKHIWEKRKKFLYGSSNKDNQS